MNSDSEAAAALPASDVFAAWLDTDTPRDDGALAALCADHPQHAGEFRVWFRQLQAIGELGSGDVSTIDGLEGEEFESCDEREGGLVGPFRLEHELGRGAQAVVWAAIDTRDGKPVALKVLPEQVARSRQRLQRFRREVELARRVRHPHLCAVHDAGSAGTTWYLAMHRVSGRTLAECIARSRTDANGPVAVRGDGTSPPTRPERLRDLIECFANIADALHTAHEHGLVHRDVKPGNLMVDREGRPVVLDFGLARESSDDDVGLTMTGDLLGTPAYMSPEQIAAQRIPLDRRTDVWSLGATLFEALTLRRPFEAPTMDRLLQQILTTDPPRIDRQERGLPRDLAVVVATCLEKDRSRRYATAADLAEDLRRVGRRQAIRAKPAGPLRRLSRFAARNPLAAALVATLAIGSVAVTVFAVSASRANARFDLISTLPELDRAEQELVDLLPAWPDRLPGLEGWLRRYGETMPARLLAVDAALEDLGPAPADDTARGLQRTLRALRSDLQAFVENPSRDGVAAARVAIDWARSLERRTIEDPAAAWSEAQAVVAADTRFAGVALEPQLGLVPCGRNPRTGLCEFVHLASHEPDAPLPQRDIETGRLQISAATGIVFVLVPGGGSRAEGGAVVPRFVAAHETTKAQWQRLSRQEDAGYAEIGLPYRRGEELYASPEDAEFEWITSLHPMEYRSFDAFDHVLRQHGLRLPTDVEWEHAARAGVTGALLCDEGALSQYANLLGRADGYVGPAPVGSLAPNDFGLFDVLGNVMEWCATPREGEAFASERGEVFHSILGGSYEAPPSFAVFTHRPAVSTTTRDAQVGIRPVRDLDH